MEVRGRRSRDMSPERIKICSSSQAARIMRPTFKRVQVVYYLSRNGQLEHPHYMEVTHLANQQLRLKDVIDRLIVLRGKGMPSLYSWSSKRSYKNGYVWNDLSENDIIYPSEGSEYILKGSEVIIDGCTGKFQQLQVGSTQQFQHLQLVNSQHHIENLNFHPKRKPPQDHQYGNEAQDNDGNEEDLEEEEEYEEKVRYTYNATTPHSRCSKGVSTDELHQHQQRVPKNPTPKNPTTEINLENSSSPPSTTSSSLSDKGMNENTNTSKRFEDGDRVVSEPLLSRNSLLFQLIGCGGSLSFRGKNVPPVMKQQQPQPTAAAARRSNCSDLHKGVLCKSANNKAVVVAAEEDGDEIKCMSENPRFGNLQSEEKEYFSGSIVESMSTEERAQVEPSSLKKSSSYNEERGSKLAMSEAVVVIMEEEVKREKVSKSKCIPRMKSSSKQSFNK